MLYLSGAGGGDWGGGGGGLTHSGASQSPKFSLKIPHNFSQYSQKYMVGPSSSGFTTNRVLGGTNCKQLLSRYRYLKCDDVILVISRV